MIEKSGAGAAANPGPASGTTRARAAACGSDVISQKPRTNGAFVTWNNLASGVAAASIYLSLRTIRNVIQDTAHLICSCRTDSSSCGHFAASAHNSYKGIKV